MPSKPMINRSKRGPFDDINTPKEAVYYLLPYLPKDKILWESAPGEGKLINLLQEAGRKVLSIEGDYFTTTPEQWDIQVTNPPFSIKAKWIKRAYLLGKPWVLLLPVTTLGVRACHPYLEGAEIIFLPRRIDFTGKKAPWFAVAWFTQGLNLGKQLIFVDERYNE